MEKKWDLGILDPEEHLLNCGTFWVFHAYFNLRNRIQLFGIRDCEVFFIFFMLIEFEDYFVSSQMFPHNIIEFQTLRMFLS